MNFKYIILRTRRKSNENNLIYGLTNWRKHYNENHRSLKVVAIEGGDYGWGKAHWFQGCCLCSLFWIWMVVT